MVEETLSDFIEFFEDAVVKGNPDPVSADVIAVDEVKDFIKRLEILELQLYNEEISWAMFKHKKIRLIGKELTT